MTHPLGLLKQPFNVVYSEASNGPLIFRFSHLRKQTYQFILLGTPYPPSSHTHHLEGLQWLPEKSRQLQSLLSNLGYLVRHSRIHQIGHQRCLVDLKTTDSIQLY